MAGPGTGPAAPLRAHRRCQRAAPTPKSARSHNGMLAGASQGEAPSPCLISRLSLVFGAEPARFGRDRDARDAFGSIFGRVRADNILAQRTARIRPTLQREACGCAGATVALPWKARASDARGLKENAHARGPFVNGSNLTRQRSRAAKVNTRRSGSRWPLRNVAPLCARRNPRFSQRTIEASHSSASG